MTNRIPNKMDIDISKKPKILFYTRDGDKIFYLRDISNVIMSYVCDNIWTFISESTILSYKELYKYRKYIDWKAYSEGCNNLTHKIIEKFRKKLVWSLIFKKWMQEGKTISENQVHFINKSIDVIEEPILRHISMDNKNWFYSEIFIDCFSDIVDWKWITKNLKLPLLLMDRYFIEMYSYDELYKRQNISDILFLKKYKKYVNWRKISRYQTLSNNHFMEFPNLLDWEYIFEKYNLDIEELKNLPKYVIYDNIDDISEKQPLTEQYIMNNNSILNPIKLLANPNISNDIHARILKSQVDEKYYFIIKKNRHIKFEY